MSHLGERLNGKSKGVANQAPDQRARDNTFLFSSELHNHFLGNCHNPNGVQDNTKEEI